MKSAHAPLFLILTHGMGASMRRFCTYWKRPGPKLWPLASSRATRAVVFVGRKSEYAREAVMEQLPTVRIFHCPHPSPQCLNTNPANRQRILDVLRKVATLIS